MTMDVTLPNILKLISQMNLNEIEEVKNKLVEKELYFKRYKKENIEDVVEAFSQEDYSSDFLKDLEDGLKKSSVYQ